MLRDEVSRTTSATRTKLNFKEAADPAGRAGWRVNRRHRGLLGTARLEQEPRIGASKNFPGWFKERRPLGRPRPSGILTVKRGLCAQRKTGPAESNSVRLSSNASRAEMTRRWVLGLRPESWLQGQRTPLYT